MDITLDDEFVTSKDDGFHRFLIKWHGRPNSLLDCYLSFHSSKSSFFKPRGNDGAWSRPISRPKRDRKPKSNDEFDYY